MRSILSTLAVAAVFTILVTTHARGADAPEKVDWPVQGGSRRSEGMSGELRSPQGRTPVAAVIILTSSPGFDGRGADYAKELNAAGFATLELDMFQGRGLPASPRETRKE